MNGCVVTPSAGTESRLARIREGEAAAIDELIADTYVRLRRLASRMLGEYPDVSRWVETDDVWQSAALKLDRALRSTTPESPLHFHRLAALQIRRTLIELARSLNGPSGLATNHETGNGWVPVRPDETNDVIALTDWAEFHEQVGALPEPERQIFDLIWYNGIAQHEAAELLDVDVRTVKRRWRKARLALMELRSGKAPGP